MMLIHDEVVGVAACPFQVRMIERKVVVGVFQGLRVIARPEPKGGQEADDSQCGENAKRCDGAGGGPRGLRTPGPYPGRRHASGAGAGAGLKQDRTRAGKGPRGIRPGGIAFGCPAA